MLCPLDVVGLSVHSTCWYISGTDVLSNCTYYHTKMRGVEGGGGGRRERGTIEGYHTSEILAFFFFFFCVSRYCNFRTISRDFFPSF